jgi:butyrate kinase
VSYILAINPGSTSTKIALFEDTRPILERSLRHSAEELAGFAHMADQFPFRESVIREALREAGIAVADTATADGGDPAGRPRSLDAVVGRGGLIRPVAGGTYAVNEAMLRDLREGYAGEHASNLGGILAQHIAEPLGIPAFIVDPVVVDELARPARLSGIPEAPRVSIFHALNQKAVARRAAAEMGRSYEEMRFIVAHLGGGTTVGVHDRGRVVDVNDGLNGEGPFTPERSGGVAALKIVELLTGRGYEASWVKRRIKGDGGLVAYCGTNSVEELEARIEAGDEAAREALEGMAYQVAKEIGAMAAVVAGNIDAILLTGGVAHSEQVVAWIRERISFLAPVRVYPGEDEMRALAEGALRVLQGQEEALTYRPEEPEGGTA